MMILHLDHLAAIFAPLSVERVMSAKWDEEAIYS